MCYSLNFQAMCDAFGKFINVEIKWPGSVYDARVCGNCEIQKRYSSGEFKMFYKELLPGRECVPQQEHGHCNSNQQVIFNQMLLSARNQIECFWETQGKMENTSTPYGYISQRYSKRYTFMFCIA